MYSKQARQVRRCKATRQDGQPCKAYALWGGQYCSGHAYTRRVARDSNDPRRYYTQRANYTPCHCEAYAWPHRPGGGLCNWPAPPRRVSTIPAGTHSWFRTYKRKYRVLVRKWGLGL